MCQEVLPSCNHIMGVSFETHFSISHSHRVGILWETLKITADYMGSSRQEIGLAFGFDQSKHGAVFPLRYFESK